MQVLTYICIHKVYIILVYIPFRRLDVDTPSASVSTNCAKWHVILSMNALPISVRRQSTRPPGPPKSSSPHTAHADVYSNTYGFIKNPKNQKKKNNHVHSAVVARESRHRDGKYRGGTVETPRPPRSRSSVFPIEVERIGGSRFHAPSWYGLHYAHVCFR